jgi:chromosome segregation ATPase
MNLDFDMGESFPAEHQEQQIFPPPQLELAANSKDPHSASGLVEQSASHIATTDDNSDVTAALDSLLTSLQLATTPCPPSLAPISESNQSVQIQATTATETIDRTQQLLQELTTTNHQLKTAQLDLQVIHQEKQSQLAAIDSRILEVKQLKFRTQQLAKHSQNRFEQAEQMLASIGQIHTDIITNLAKFGGHAEIQAMLGQLETTRHSLVIAHDRATTGQEAFYDSLKAIEHDVATRSAESEHKLGDYQELMQNLAQTITTDRLQIASMNGDLSTKLTNLDHFNTQIAATHTEMVATAQTMQSRIAEIDRGFVELVASVQTEKEQFYELTVETIEKADAIKSQLANIGNQISADRESISALKAELESLRHNIRQETEHKLHNLDLRYHQIISMWDDFQLRQKDRAVHPRQFTRWLWVLSIAVICIFVMLIRVMMILK